MQVRSFRQQALAFAVAAAFPPCVLAQTLPTGGEVRPEQASIFQTSPTSLHIQQHADKAILNWQSFSIGAGAQVNFQQPSSSSIALNRVLGNNPSQIFGHLGANGRVFLVNPSGILFGPGSSVNVGALVASTLSITDDDFMAGRYVFSNAGGAGSILNQGNLFSHSGYTALLAPQVTNEGFIFANLGSVAFAAGDRVTLDMVGDNLIRVNVDQATLDAAVVNRGSIEAFGGNVLLTAHSANAVLDTVLNTEGIVRAFGMTEQDGQIVLHGGSRGTTALSGEISSSSSMAISGDAVVIAGGGGRDAIVAASQDQTIDARSVAITAADGNNVTLTSFGGDQSITVRDGDHIRIQAPGGGDASLLASNGKQTLEIEGNGRNAIEIGSAGGLGGVMLSSKRQTLLAGRAGESGSITLIGPDADGKAVLVEAPNFDGIPSAQSISTSGTLRVTGGERPGGVPLINGFLQSGAGQQVVNARRVEVLAGGSGAGNVAWISSVTGDQTVTVAEDIEIAGGPGGEAALHVSFSPQLPSRPGTQAVSARNVSVRGAPAGVNGNAFLGSFAGGAQTLDLTGNLMVAAGAGGRAGVSSNAAQTIGAANISVIAAPGNGASVGSGAGQRQTITAGGDIEIAGGASSNASISAGGAGAVQTIRARSIAIRNGIDSPGDSAGVILGAHQDVQVTGDVTLTANSGTGSASGVRIGAQGAGATDLVLTVGGDLLLRGGTSGTNGAGLGGAGSGTTSRNDIAVTVAGDVTLDGAFGGGGVRIGSSGLTPVQGGDISVTARNIRFTGTARAAIRTTGNVELVADEIIQGANGLILANALGTQSQGATLLDGANQVSSYAGSSAAGDIRLKNVSPLLTLGDVDTPGSLAIDSAGDVRVNGGTTVWASGPLSMNVGGSFEMRGGDAFLTPAIVRGGAVDVSTGGDLRLVGGAGHLSPALFSSGGDAHLTVGGTLRLDAGGGFLSVARVQSESWGSVIHLAFPNLSTGGFYVNGVEGAVRDGQSGFFVFLSPARIGRTLILDYE